MKKEIKKTKQGHTYFAINYDEMVNKLRGGGICDSCSPIKKMKNGFLIPVLNSVYCEECFNKWCKDAVFYDEDIEYERQSTEKFLQALNT